MPSKKELSYRLLVAGLVCFFTFSLPARFLLAQNMPPGAPGDAGPPPEMAPDSAGLPPEPVPGAAETPPEPEAAPAKQSLWEKMQNSNMLIKYKKGGPVMHGITLDSIVGLMVVLERYNALKRKKIFPNKFVSQVNDKLKDEDNRLTYEELAQICKDHNETGGSIGRVLLSGTRLHHEGFSNMRSAVENATVKEAANFESNMSFLGLLANLAPLLGFLGTVTGMIGAFEAMAKMASTRPEVVGGGISEALITTAYGLFVGIPLVVLYYGIKTKVDSLTIELEETAVEILEQIEFKDK